LKRFFDPSRIFLTPSDIVLSFTGKSVHELSLPARAVITFSDGDLKRVMKSRKTIINEAWQPYRTIHHIEESATLMTRSFFGGPNIAALVEELAAFGMKECVLWGYCGAINKDMDIGDVIVVKSALREDGVSYHYLEEDEDFVESNWLEEWMFSTKNNYNFRAGAIWSIDALYRETEAKISRYREMGILGVEMEVASFYAVCRYTGVRGIAFLVVSDVFRDSLWKSGFHTKPFREGVKRLTGFVIDQVIR
jgi:uridine phosphorylase